MRNLGKPDPVITWPNHRPTMVRASWREIYHIDTKYSFRAQESGLFEFPPTHPTTGREEQLRNGADDCAARRSRPFDGDPFA